MPLDDDDNVAPIDRSTVLSRARLVFEQSVVSDVEIVCVAFLGREPEILGDWRKQL